MDRTLNEYVMRANNIKDINFKNLTNTKKITIQNELKYMLANIEKTQNHLKDVLNSLKVENQITGEYTLVDKSQPDSILLAENKVKYINSREELKKIKNGIFYIPEINQFCIKINNMELFGNFGNIFDKRLLYNDNIVAHQVMPCESGNSCRNILNEKYCKFWHDPKQLVVLKKNKIISSEYYYKTIKLTRNFANTSWLYSSDFKKSDNKRYIGSKSSIINDIRLCKIMDNYKEQIANIKAQIVHDIIFLMILNEYKLV
jgi:hypothetical protein